MRRRLRQGFGLLCLTTVFASPVRAQIAPPPSEPEPAGSARVTGRVLASDNRAPVRRALVRLAGLPDASRSPGSNHRQLQRDVETDDHGAFEFVELPGGSYFLTVPRTNGFVGLERARRAAVTEGGVVDVTIRLERTGAIAGRLVDRNGDGVLGVEVQALRKNDFRGYITHVPEYGARVSTNDLGQFRLFNLSPGEYVVVATEVHPDRAVRTTRRSGFLTTYYPGARALGDARDVVVRAGKDSTNVNFALTSGPLARVAIDAVDSSGRPLGREASATLNSLGDAYLSSSSRQAHRDEDGRFLFAEIPPGPYYLIVSTSYRREEAAYVDITVDADVTLKVQTNAGARISGRIVLQGPPRNPASGALGKVAVTASRPLGKNGPSYTKEPLPRQDATDTFELTGLRGPMVLHAEMPGASLVSIRRAGGEDLAGRPVVFTGTETLDDLLVVFTTERAEVEVTLTGLREPEDPESVLVMLFAEDPARWHAGSLHYTSIEASAEMPLQRGGRTFSFRLGPVVPGRYLVAAVPSPGVMFPTEPAILERLRPIAVPVTVVAGATAKADVRVSRTGK